MIKRILAETSVLATAALVPPVGLAIYGGRLSHALYDKVRTGSVISGMTAGIILCTAVGYNRLPEKQVIESKGNVNLVEVHNVNPKSCATFFKSDPFQTYHVRADDIDFSYSIKGPKDQWFAEVKPHLAVARDELKRQADVYQSKAQDLDVIISD